MHPNLSPALNALVQASETNPGIDIKSQQKGAMFDVITRHTKYTIVVVDPEKQEVAMTHNNPKIPEGTDLWYLMGAGWGSSVMKVGYVVVGAQMRMRRLAGGLIETSPVQSFTFRDEPQEAKHIMEAAEANRPQYMTDEEQRQYEADFAREVEEIITKEFPADLRNSVRKLVGYFGNTSGKGVALGVLSQAQKYGKLAQALQLLQRDCERHWYFQPPAVAGDPEFMPMNARRWDALYQELGVPLPSEGSTNVSNE